MSRFFCYDVNIFRNIFGVFQAVFMRVHNLHRDACPVISSRATYFLLLIMKSKGEGVAAAEVLRSRIICILACNGCDERGRK